MALITIIFVVGYLAIVFEHPLKVTKSASALLVGVLCWTVRIVMMRHEHESITSELQHHFGDVAGILFFLLGAMTIVELIDAHDGFELITTRIRSLSRRKLLVSISLLSFFLSAILDNLTTSIVMVSLIRKLMDDDEDRIYFGGVVIIAANAGGSWSPIGDVTTTMLWIGGAITAGHVMQRLFLPALVSLLVPAIWIGIRMKGDVRRQAPLDDDAVKLWLDAEIARVNASTAPTHVEITLPACAAAVGRTLAVLNLRARTEASVLSIKRDSDSMLSNPSPREPLRAGDVLEIETPTPEAMTQAITLLASNEAHKTTARERAVVLFVGVGVFLLVPVFKAITHLPPVMGILLGLAILWTVTELIHKRKNDEGKGALSVAGALQRVDAPSILFFLGILLSISALQSAGVLSALARAMNDAIGNVSLITMTIGLSSSVIDNVPLVAAAQGMYPLSTYPTNHHFWIFLAYCAGTGGSILIIGSAAGIAVMGIQRITFGWYLRKFSLPVLIGYVAGAMTYLLFL